MLEQYFTKPQTADRIKESWIGQSIEKYVIWLSDQGYAAMAVHRRVPFIRRFGEGRVLGFWAPEKLKNFQSTLIHLLIPGSENINGEQQKTGYVLKRL